MFHMEEYVPYARIRTPEMKRRCISLKYERMSLHLKNNSDMVHCVFYSIVKETDIFLSKNREQSSFHKNFPSFVRMALILKIGCFLSNATG